MEVVQQSEMKMVWNSDALYALGLYRKIGRILGIWPLEFTDTFPKIRLTFVTITSMWISIDIMKQFIINGNCGTITEIVDAISLFTCGCLSVIKLIILTIHQNNMSEIVKSAVNDWSQVIDHKSRSIMRRYAKLGRTVFISQVIGYCFSGLLLISSRFPYTIFLWNNQSNVSIAISGVPLWPTCWIPTDISMGYYLGYFIFQSVSLTVFDASYSSCDSFFFGMAMHLCGQFKILSTNSKYLHGIGDPGHQTCELAKFINRHRHLLMLANMFEKTYNVVILIHTGVAAMIICISGIILLIGLQSSDFAIVSDMISRIILCYLQLFMYSYAGEQLRFQAMKSRNAIYNSLWYNMSTKTIKDMMFTIMRCDYAFNLTAGKMYNMNFFTFVSIVKTISSYFSVIRLMLKEDH